MTIKAASLLNSIGNTPLVEILNLNPHKKVKILAKLEGSNPGGSVKDRTAYYMIKKAEESGELTRDKTIIEATSGNTGIALAMIGAAKGYRVVLTMPECVSVERRRILEAYGTELVITPGQQSTDGAILRAFEIYNSDPEKYYMPNQFDNPANVLAHYETTGPEIWRDTDGKVTHYIAGMGTSGTLIGVRNYLKEKNPEIQVIGIEPSEGHKIQGLKNMTECQVPKIYNPDLLDEIINVKDHDAFETARNLAVKEGLFVGMSSGAALAGALKLAEKLDDGIIVTIFPDRGDRYLSTNLFMSICAKCPP